MMFDTLMSLLNNMETKLIDNLIREQLYITEYDYIIIHH